MEWEQVACLLPVHPVTPPSRVPELGRTRSRYAKVRCDDLACASVARDPKRRFGENRLSETPFLGGNRQAGNSRASSVGAGDRSPMAKRRATPIPPAATRNGARCPKVW